jgi:hypothetical protein
MKKTFIISLIFLILCLSTGHAKKKFKKISFMGDYPKTPYIIKTDKSFNDVWENIIDLLAMTGMSVKMIDKENGIIISEITDMANVTSFENEDGSLMNPNAFVAAESYEYPMNTFSIGSLLCSWNIRVKDKNDFRIIMVNLTFKSIVVNGHTWADTYDVTKYPSYYKPEDYPPGIKSTGVFEQSIIDFIN